MKHSALPTSLHHFVLYCVTAAVAVLVVNNNTSSSSSTTVAAFPHQAGGCNSGAAAAVAGRHVANNGGRRRVTTGALADHGIQFFVDGVEFKKIANHSGTIMEVQSGVEHVLEIVATQNPFKGALIRVEESSSSSSSVVSSTTTATAATSTAQSQSPLFVLTPMINAQSAIACSSSLTETTATGNGNHNHVQGVTHTNSRLKYALSAAFFIFDTPDDNDDTAGNSSSAAAAGTGSGAAAEPFFVLDVTVVDSNNATGSVYWYSRYRIQSSATAAPVSAAKFAEEEDEVPSPSIGAAPRFFGAPTTPKPTIRGGPSSVKLKKTVTAPTATPSPTTYAERCSVCGDGMRVGAPRAAELLLILDKVVTSCEKVQADGDSGRIPPAMCTIVRQAAVTACGCVPIVDKRPTTPVGSVVEPTVSPVPTVSAYPTFAEKCLVCGKGRKVTAFDVMLNVDGGVGTCLDLERQGASGFVNPSVCADARAIATAQCGCAPVAALSSSSSSSSSNSNSNILSSAETFVPTVTPFPTASASPTFREKCHVCLLPGNQATLPNAIVVVDNIAMLCGELEEAGLGRRIPPDLCPTAQAKAQGTCGCGEANSPSTAPPLTFTPTITANPTTTPSPTYAEKCLVCGGDTSLFVTKAMADVTVDGMVLSCGELEEAGSSGIIPPRVCMEAMLAAEEVCGCAPAPSPDGAPTIIPSTLEPTTTAYPTVTSSPTYSEKCFVCGDDEAPEVTNNNNNNADGSITIGGTVWSCSTVQELGAAGYLPPGAVCASIQKQAKVSCACSSNNSRTSPTTSTRNLAKVATTTPPQLPPSGATGVIVGRMLFPGLTALVLATWIL